MPRRDIPQLDPPVVASGNNEPVVELDRGDAIIVSADALEACIGREVEYDDATVPPAGHENVARELELADEGSVALEKRNAFAVVPICHSVSEAFFQNKGGA